jgi:hypothetical protein
MALEIWPSRPIFSLNNEQLQPRRSKVHKVLFYPVGNGDTSQVILENGKRFLFDFCHRVAGEDPESPLIDLKKRLKDELKAAERDYFDVVALTHGDDDHISGSTSFFELQHNQKYQGKDRIKIAELWVPAAMLLEECEDGSEDDEVMIWRREARHRLREGYGIRVFSKPDQLKDWMKSNGLTVESRKHLITDAGQVVPGYSLAADGVEFFAHSPLIKHMSDGDQMRNACTLILQVRMELGGVRTDFLEMGDTGYEELEDVVNATKAHGNDDRLDWNLFNIPHHCSYLALGPEKSKTETVPTEKVKELLRHGQPDAFIVSSSNIISDDAEAYEQAQPPHVQARNAYETYLKEVDGNKFLATMSEPNGFHPEPIEFEVSDKGLRRASARRTAGAVAAVTMLPRAG